MLCLVAHSCLTFYDPVGCRGSYSPWDSPGKNPGVGSCSFLREIFPTQELNPDLLPSKWILYQLSQQGSPRLLE